MFLGKSWKSVFVVRPTDQTSVAQGVFLGGFERRAVAQTRPAAPKNVSGPVIIPLQAPDDKLSPSKEG